MYENSYDGSMDALGAGLGIFVWVIIAALYLYFAFTQYKIAQKCGCHDSAWWSWIPIMNTFLLIKMARKEWWWFVLCLVPIVNIVAFAMLWIQAAKLAGHAPIWGFLVLVPGINFVAMGVMAFSGERPATLPPSDHEPHRESQPVK